ncbi:MAG: pyruvate kinase [Clostridia bacterium]|nr:pyruvate kinase [Clostridia bacterium]NLS86099.1 pyruvate kinase [Oscillospiraceae bacterium]
MNRKTKIICTLGPATDADGVLRNMMLAGMNVARFNFSHGDHAGHKTRLESLKALREELGVPVAALLDTKGPEIRLKKFKGGKAELKTGQIFTLTTKEIEGDSNACSITYKELPSDVAPGTRILLDDGLISMVVATVDDDDICCKVLNGGLIKNQKGVNLPGTTLSMPYMSAQDKDDILFGVQEGFNFVAASFCRSAQDIFEIRRLLESVNCSTIKIIAKIENQEGVNNIDEIIAAADGIMVARGDMGVEIDFAEIPIIQKDIIWRCYNAGKPVITATQMLESMMENPRPTRAEITDVANAIYDGTSAIMLSGETAAGAYPVEAVTTMAAIAERTESDINYNKRMKLRGIEGHLTVAAAVSHAACTTAMDINANAIITVTKSGETARLICKYRPSTPMIACVVDDSVYYQLALSWGITPIRMSLAHSTDELVAEAIKTAKTAGLVNNGDMVVLTAGVPLGVSGTTNMIRAHLVGDSLIAGIGIGGKMGKGKTCVCRSIEELSVKFKPGNVLVVPSTSNEMMPYLRGAAGIIAEEAGSNSHAAIVGLSLDIPVVIGATGATRTIKDGMDVSVDGERGIVRSMLE